jgi:surfactin synthase thioesterase subunit
VTKHRWIVSGARPRSPRLRLYLFPYAGRGASMYASWPTAFGPDVEVCPVQLPGREDRFNEPAARRMAPLVERFLADVGGELATAPFALFGHSMGGLIAYEIARRLQASGARGPELLFVSASAPPGARARRSPLYVRSDAEIVAELRRWNGTPEQVLREPSLLQLVLPIIRADLELLHHYHVATPAAGARLACPLLAFGGTRDQSVAAVELAQWRDFTGYEFELRMIEGDHFFINNAANARGLQATIAAALDKIARAPRPADSAAS